MPIDVTMYQSRNIVSLMRDPSMISVVLIGIAKYNDICAILCKAVYADLSDMLRLL